MSRQDVFHSFMGAAFACATTDEKVELAHARRWPSGKGVGFWPFRWKDGANVEPHGLYYNCTTFRDGTTGATAGNAVRAHVVMFDDVGSIPGKSVCPIERVLELRAPPHAVISTRADSEGRLNCQAVWFIEPATPETAAALVKAAAKARWCDPGATGGVRWARPPGSLKHDGNGHVARLVVANFDRERISLEDLAEVLHVDLQPRRGPQPRAADHDGDRSGDHDRQRRDAACPPRAEVVQAVLDAIPNWFARDDWVRIGLALKSCCGPSPALGDEAGLDAFLAFSRDHPSFNELHTRRFWATAQPSGLVGFGTLVHFARENGWTAVEFELGRPASNRRAVVAFDQETARAAMAASGLCHALVVPEMLSPWFAPAAAIRDVLIAVPKRDPHADAFGLHDPGPALNRLATRLARMRLMVRMITVEPVETAPEPSNEHAGAERSS